MSKINSWADITAEGSSRARTNEVTHRSSKLKQPFCSPSSLVRNLHLP